MVVLVLTHEGVKNLEKSQTKKMIDLHFVMKLLIVFSYRSACNTIAPGFRNNKVHTYTCRFETRFSDTRRNAPQILEAQSSRE